MENGITQGIIIAGPTASGKSALAIEYALKHPNSIIINADSRQIYKELPILCACPSAEDYAQATHALYCKYDATKEISVYDWLEDIANILNQNKDAFPIVVGGTGFYIDALLNGVYQTYPPEKISTLNLHSIDIQKQYDQLNYKQHIKDTMRMKRTLDIVQKTGIMPDQLPKIKLIDRNWQMIYLNPVNLDDNINKRLHRDIDLMIQEVKNAPNILGTKLETTIGFQQIHAFLNDNLTKKELLDSMFVKTRQYAKRQRTWFKKYFLPYTNAS